MGSPMPEKDNKKRLDIVCSLIQPVREYLLKGEKAGDATEVVSYGDKETEKLQGQIVNEFMSANVSLHQWGYDENNLPTRIVNGKKIRINENLMKQLVEDRKKLELKRTKSKKIEGNDKGIGE